MDLQELKKIQVNFLKELQDASMGKKTSLAFIVNEIPASSLVKKGEKFEVLVVGGSICKKAILVKKNGISITKQETIKQPSFKKTLDFLEFVEKNLEKNINFLALNFAYPLNPIFINKKLDGILIRGAKENAFSGLIGKKIGEEVEKYIFQKTGKKIIVSLANDTICLLLSGLTKYSSKNLSAGIVGTGLNFAMFINQNKLVNLESANFDKFSQTKEGKIIDDQSSSPKGALFEKETSGAYLYKHFNIILKEKNLSFPPIESTEKLNSISLQYIPTVSGIARDLIRRSAKLIACQIAGIVDFKKTDMTFVMEGSLFWKGNNYKQTVDKTLRKLNPKYKVNFIEIKESAILGAAKLIS